MEFPVQESDDFRSGTGFIRAECVRAGAVGDVFLHRPYDSGIVVTAPDVHKGIRHAPGCRLMLRSPEEGDHLPPGAAGIGRKHTVARAVGDVLLHGPKHCFIIIIGRLNVAEGTGGSSRLRAAVCPLEEGDDLTSRAFLIDAEFPLQLSFGEARRYLFLVAPQYSIVEDM